MAMGAEDKNHLVLRRYPLRIKVFGERHTGTRAVLRMLNAHKRPHKGVDLSERAGARPRHRKIRHQQRWEKGFNKELYKDIIEGLRRRNEGGVSAWKHAAPMIDDSYGGHNRAVLFLVRDPYSWMVSFYKKPYHARQPAAATMEAFLRQPWQTVQRDNLAAVLPSPMALWTEKLRAYRRFIEAASVPTAVLHFEDFVCAPVAALGAALAQVGIAPEGLKPYDKPTKSWGLSEQDRRAYYQAEGWKAEISAQSAGLIDGLVDWEVAAYFGYAPRGPLAF